MNSKQRIKLIIPIVGSLVLIDQVTKYLATIYLKGAPEQHFFGGFFRLLYVINRGAWGSLGAEWPEIYRKAFLIILPVVFVLGLLVYMLLPKIKLKKVEYISYSFIVAGGIGNLIDRIYADGVIDMLWMGIAKYRYLQTNVFNIADVAIMAGFFLLLIDGIKGFIKGENSGKPS